MKTLKEKIKVEQACLDGKEIEKNPYHGITGWNEDKDPIFNWFQYDYRIKQDPMTIWCNIYDNVVYVYKNKEHAINVTSMPNIIRKAVEFIEVT